MSNCQRTTIPSTTFPDPSHSLPGFLTVLSAAEGCGGDPDSRRNNVTSIIQKVQAWWGRGLPGRTVCIAVCCLSASLRSGAERRVTAPAAAANLGRSRLRRAPVSEIRFTFLRAARFLLDTADRSWNVLQLINECYGGHFILSADRE